MDDLSAVSETALITLKARAVETEKNNPVIKDKVGVECLNRIRHLLPVEVLSRIPDRKLPPALTRHVALRARKYDMVAKRFINENPDGLVVNLGCGFDTRYWRVSEKAWKYVEIDLPGVIGFKKNMLSDIADYKMIACSVLDERWIKEIQLIQNENVLFLAEGLFMYLPREGVIRIFEKLSESFSRSHICFEVAAEKYTRGIWKMAVAFSMKHSLKMKESSPFEFGVRDAKEIESFGKNIKVVEEWSYLEDGDVVPRILKYLSGIPFFSRTLWTIQAIIG